jgi:hypothetical protein
MPRPKKQQRPQFELKGFISCDLSKDLKEQGKVWVAQHTDDLGAKVEALATDGYKISMSADRIHDCFQASATCTDAENADYGFCLTARAPDIWSALGMLLYKHYVVLEGEWASREATASSADKWA